MEYYQIIADRIIKLSNKRGLSINQVASMSNIKQQTLNSIIHGASKNPQLKTLHKIALTFGMTVSEFLNFQELNDYSFDEDDSQNTE